jgi:hypothetical protein
MSRKKPTNWKRSLSLFLELLPVVLAVVVPLIEVRMKAFLTAQVAPPPGRTKWYAVAGVLIYAAFIAVTVLFVKLAWRWVL